MNKQEIEKAIRSMRNLDDVISITASEHEAVKLAIEALEKQIPKKPELVPEPYDDGVSDITKYIDLPYCQNCGDLLHSVIDSKHCVKCGQAIDWSKDE